MTPILFALLLAQQPCEVAPERAVFSIPHVTGEPALNADPLSETWKRRSTTEIVHDCSKKLDYPELKTTIQGFWTDTSLYLLFTCPYDELNLWLPADNAKARDKLWDRDVVEMFLGDDWTNIRHYREFEMAPTGDWIDLAIDLEHESYDQHWRSGWKTVAHIDEKTHTWYAAARIPLASVSAKPVQAGTRWRANLYRIHGRGPDSERKFLCWQPTCVVNRDPNHVPEHFGTLVFVEDALAEGRKRFEARCSGCHGTDGAGGERAPAIERSESAHTGSAEAIRELLRTGIPDAGMPAFSLPEDEMRALVEFVRSRVTPAAEFPTGGDARLGEAYFRGQGGCAACHMVGGRGGLNGPDLTNIGRERTLGELERALRIPGGGRYKVVSDGRGLRGFLRNETSRDAEMQTLDGRLVSIQGDHLTRLTREPASYMPALADPPVDLLAYLSSLVGKPATPAAETIAAIDALPVSGPDPGDWPTYNGQLSGNRHSALRQIDRTNITGLAPRWMYPVQGARHLEVTPVVVDGVMYVTNVNQCFAIDARTGREYWRYARPRTKGLVGDAAGGINRGVAIHGNRVFMVTDNAHLIALHRVTGALLWDVEMADAHKHYGATSAPLAVNDVVISGTSGGDEGIRGFVAGYKASSGERVWRFWTTAEEHGCAATWLTGTYDAQTNLAFWTTGNPCPDFNGDGRPGDDLYSSSVLALRPETGELVWHYQFTPHDLHDWDAVQTPVLVDMIYHGQPRKLLLQGNRNGFFYVLDRTNGQFLAASPFVKALTWASGIGKNGWPLLLPGAEPTMEGVRVCPSMDGATNWMSTAFNPDTGLFYLMALEKCSIFRKSAEPWKQGESFYGGSARDVPGERTEKVLRAIRVETGEVAWEVPQLGALEGNTWGGLLSTASGVLFYAGDSGAFEAADARTGEALWQFQTNQSWKASPMTYMVDGKQYVAIAAGGNVVAFGLP